MAIQSMVTRRDYRGREWGANQKVTVDEALTDRDDQRRVRVIRREDQGVDHGGQATPTSWYWRKIRMTSIPNTIKDIKVVRTVVGGKTVIRRLRRLRL